MRQRLRRNESMIQARTPAFISSSPIVPETATHMGNSVASAIAEGMLRSEHDLLLSGYNAPSEKAMPKITEIAPDVYRICIFYPEINLQFNHFLVKDDEPLLFHTGLRRMWPQVREGVSKIIDPAKLRWISWSHFEADECGSLNEWLA